MKLSRMKKIYLSCRNLKDLFLKNRHRNKIYLIWNIQRFFFIQIILSFVCLCFKKLIHNFMVS